MQAVFGWNPRTSSGLVRMLLTLVSMASEPGVETADARRSSEAPLLAASLSIGETTDGQALLGIEVGCVQLALSVPQAALAELAYAMLAATARPPIADIGRKTAHPPLSASTVP